MNNVKLDLLADDMAFDTDIDALMAELETIAPPTNFIAQVMHAVAHLPLPKNQPALLGNHLIPLLVGHNRDGLC